MGNDDQKPWIDFKQIKEDADIERVLELCGVLDGLKRQGAELVGWCPLGKADRHGKNDSFCFNTQKKAFQCFACKARGSILDFVGQFHGMGLREAATYVADASRNAQEYAPRAAALNDAVVRAAEAAEQSPESMEDFLQRLAEQAASGVTVVGVMTLAECLRRIKAKELHPRDVRCVNINELLFNH